MVDVYTHNTSSRAPIQLTRTQWHHVAITYEAREGLVHYVDGTRYGNATDVTAQISTNQAFNTTGIYLSYCAVQKKGRASYRDIAVWERTLTEPDIASMVKHTPGCQEIDFRNISWSASSADGAFQAKYAFFDSTTAWCADPTVTLTDSFLVVQFPTVYKVYSLVLRQKDFESKEYVTSFQIMWSLNGEMWGAYTSYGGLSSTTNFKVFPLTNGPIVMRYLRIKPRYSNGRKCLRLKVCGYKLGPLNITAAVRNEEDAPRCSVMVNNMEYCVNGAGHNLVLFNLTTGEHLGAVNFDTHTDLTAGDAMGRYIDAIANGTLVIVVVKYSGHRNTPKGLLALVDVGAKRATPLEERTPWILIGLKGRLEKWVTETSATRDGELQTTMSIPLQTGLRESHYWPLDTYDYKSRHGNHPHYYYRQNFRDRRGDLDINVQLNYAIQGGILRSNKGRMDTHKFKWDCITDPLRCPGGVTVSWWWRHTHDWLLKGEYHEPPGIVAIHVEMYLQSRIGLIRVDRHYYTLETDRHNVVLLKYGSGRVIDVKSFDLANDATASDRFNDLIKSAPNGTVVLIAVKGSSQLTSQALIDTLKSVGARDPSLVLGDSYCLMGYKGLDAKAWVDECKLNQQDCFLLKYMSLDQSWRASVGMQSGRVQDWQITSNNVDASNPPSAARLHTVAAGWRGLSAGSYLQIQLPVVTLLAGFATQGRNGANDWVTSYGIMYAVDNTVWIPLAEDGIVTEYAGNSDQATVISHRFRRPLNTRMLRLVAVTYNGVPYLRTELYQLNHQYNWIENQVVNEAIDTPDSPKALIGGDPNFSAVQLAGSSRTDLKKAAPRGFLHNQPSSEHGGCWCASGGDSLPRLTAWLKKTVLVTGVALQGRPDVAEWVTKFSISYKDSRTSNAFINVQENGIPKVFEGSFDSNTVVSITFPNAVYADAVGFIAKAWHHSPCLRVEVYGYPLRSACFGLLGVQGPIPNSRLSALSSIPGFEPSKGRLHGTGAWCAVTSHNSYLQIDLGELTVVSGIATQGSPSGIWSTRFFVSHSREGLEWSNYTKGGEVKVFEGNVDSSSVVVNPIYQALETRFVRVHPADGHSASTVCLRVELYGCFQENPKFELVGPVEIDAANSSSINITASYRYCQHSLPCPDCKRQIYIEFSGVVVCAVSQALYDCDYHQFEQTLHVPSEPDIYNIRVFDRIGDSCDEQVTRTTAGKLVGRVLAKVHNARNCLDVLLLGQRKSGVYYIRKSDGGIASVYCDQTTHGGGWTVLQKRVNGSVDFYKTWAEYKEGFGSLEGELWAGNDNIHAMTTVTPVELLIELEDFTGEYRYAKYDTFTVGNEASSYLLTVSGYSGTAGDSFSSHNGYIFMTKDRDPTNHCMTKFKTGFWYLYCKDADLNMVYSQTDNDNRGIKWEAWKGISGVLKASHMKIRPKQGPIKCYSWGCFYLVNAKRLSWYTAVEECRAIGAEIVTITNSDENADIVSLMTSHGVEDIWIGINDIDVESRFEWQDGSNSAYRSFKAATGNRHNYDCVRMHASTGQWTAYGCSWHASGYVCKRALMCYRGSCYTDTGEQTSVSASTSYCLQNGMDAVKILDNSENDFVRSRVATQTTFTALGLSDEITERTFLWSDNSTSSQYVNFAAGEPSGHRAENCVAMASSGKWVDFPCSDSINAKQVCEKEVVSSCQELFELGAVKSGVYHITPYVKNNPQKPIKVFCDQDNDGGGWEVIFRRQDGSVSFHDKLWADFRDGIGDIEDKEFYLGHENIRKMVSREVLFKLVSGGVTHHVRFAFFQIEGDKYKLRIYHFIEGNLTAHIAWHSEKYFSTSAVDNDKVPDKSCADLHGPGWHYNFRSYTRDCYRPLVNLFAPWSDTVGGNASYLFWETITAPISYIEIKLRYVASGYIQGIMTGMVVSYSQPQPGLHVSHTPHQIIFRAITTKATWDLVCSPHHGWTYYTFSYSENNGARIYENGVLVSHRRFLSRNTGNSFKRQNVLFGHYIALLRGSLVFLLRSLKIWNKQLSIEDIWTEYSTANASIETFGLEEWKQGTEDDFDWTVNTGCTASTNTGPCIDSTFGHPRGAYVLLEASAPNLPDKRAVLVSQSYLPMHKCFKFSFHMHGRAVGELTITLVEYERNKLYSEIIQHESIIWNRKGDQGDMWRHVELAIDTNMTYQILVTGRTENSYEGDIAIDDMSFTVEKCLSNFSSSCLPCREGHQCIEERSHCDCEGLKFVNATCHDVLRESTFKDAAHYWALDNPAAVADFIGGLKGNASAAVKLVNGVVNKAVETDGKATRIVFGDLNSSCILASPACERGFTLSFWLKYPQNVNRERRVYLSLGHITSNARGIQILQDYTTVSNQSHLIIDSTIHTASCTIGFKVMPAVWSSLTLTWSNTTGWLVIHNNRNVTEFFVHQCAPVESVTPSSTVLMTGNQDNQPALVIDDLAIWTRVVDFNEDQQRFRLYTAPKKTIFLSGKFPDEIFTESMNNRESSEYTTIKSKLEQNFAALFAATGHFENVGIHDFRNGCVIADVTLRFSRLDDRDVELLRTAICRDRLLHRMPVMMNTPDVVIDGIPQPLCGERDTTLGDYFPAKKAAGFYRNTTGDYSCRYNGECHLPLTKRTWKHRHMQRIN